MIQYAWRGWILAAMFGILAFARWRSHAPLLPAWLGLVALGIAYRLYAGRFIPGHSNFLRLSGENLVMRGPYLIGRHPLYLSNLATIAGLILFANCLPAWGAIMVMGIAFVHHEILARAEERYLAAAWGEAYLSYMHATPRWLGWPRKPYVSGPAPESSMAASWTRQGANLGKTLACVAFLWILTFFSR